MNKSPQRAAKGFTRAFWVSNTVELFERMAYYAVNKDYPEEQKGHQGFSRKLKADMFIDDRNLGGLPDWGVIYAMIKEKKTFADVYGQNGEEEKTPSKKKKGWLPF